MRFRKLDLNLLVVLDALLREHSVSKAAKELNLSQPAVSSALGRLRAYFHDEILVARGKGMEPTALAKQLAPEVARILAEIDGLIALRQVPPLP